MALRWELKIIRKSQDYVYGIWQYKVLSIYIYTHNITNQVKSFERKNDGQTWVMYKSCIKAKNNRKLRTTTMLPHLIIRRYKYNMVRCNISLVNQSFAKSDGKVDVDGNLKVSWKAMQAEFTCRNYWVLRQWNRVPTGKPLTFSMIFQWYFKTKIPNFHDNSERYKTEKHRTMCYTWSPHISYDHWHYWVFLRKSVKSSY